jgi:predicted nuclease of predicted toxin-antitoxin system
MRVLIDECLNWRLSRALTGHYAASAQKKGWGGIKNGALLALAEKDFDVFITGDRNLSFQQAVGKFDTLSLFSTRPARNYITLCH